MQRYGLHQRAAERFGRAGDAGWTLITAAILLSVNAWLAVALDSSLLFASLGPIIYQMIDEPLAPASSPRSVVIANGVAIAIGYAALAAFGLLAQPPATAGVTIERAVAAACALGATGALIVLLHAFHPPAGATTLLVSLGFIRRPIPLLIMFAGIIVIVAAGVILNRLAGVPVPVWSGGSASRPGGRAGRAAPA